MPEAEVIYTGCVLIVVGYVAGLGAWILPGSGAERAGAVAMLAMGAGAVLLAAGAGAS